MRESSQKITTALVYGPPSSEHLCDCSLNPDGGAFETGLINVGDEILSVDGIIPNSTQHVMVLCVLAHLCARPCARPCTCVSAHVSNGYDKRILIKDRQHQCTQMHIEKQRERERERARAREMHVNARSHARMHTHYSDLTWGNQGDGAGAGGL